MGQDRAKMGNIGQNWAKMGVKTEDLLLLNSVRNPNLAAATKLKPGDVVAVLEGDVKLPSVIPRQRFRIPRLATQSFALGPFKRRVVLKLKGHQTARLADHAGLHDAPAIRHCC